MGKPTTYDLVKHIRIRKYVWLVAFIVTLLVDEYVKEGYWFNAGDIFVYGTHEFLISLLTLATILLAICDLIEKSKKNE